MRKCIAVAVLFLLVFSSAATLPLPVNGVTSQTFRPFYTGFQSGTAGPYTTPTNLTAITREWNFEGWNISSLTMYVVWCNFNQSGAGNSSNIQVYFSQDAGATYTLAQTFSNQLLDFQESYPGGFSSAVASYDLTANASLFNPSTRLKIEVDPVEINTYLSVLYWGSGQTPTPPYDYIDESSNYVQYSIYFSVDYSENKIPYVGNTLNFTALPITTAKIKAAADMVVATMQPSGASNEIVGKPFGTDTWLVIYSSQLGMMSLIEAEKVLPNENYLLAVKRFIPWMFSKQNVDGSFYFTLTDGDQHVWSNATAGEWYGYDKIDSFSACAISLMRKYYDATGDLVFVNSYWSQIDLCKMFLTDLMNTTLWIPVDGYHYNISPGYTKSTTSLLHDSCEVYQALKDYAYLEGERGNSSESAYWDAYGDAAANGIRTCFWNESLQRYSGYYDLSLEKQDTTQVYSAIAPVNYAIETNVTRAALTIEAYANWGLLAGRYAETDNAEYTTMASMLFKAIAKLSANFSLELDWMRSTFYNVTEFLFANPMYPQLNMQNTNGLLDYANLVSGAYAADYARLIEASAWFITGLTETLSLSTVYSSLPTQSSNWSPEYIAFSNSTGLTYNTNAGYAPWINWLASRQEYVSWYTYQFRNFLASQGYVGNGLPWWENWIPPLDWLRIFTVNAYGQIPTPTTLPQLYPTPTNDETSSTELSSVLFFVILLVALAIIVVVIIAKRKQ